MEISARAATVDDVAELVRIYERLREEMAALKEIWGVADGLAAPIHLSWTASLNDERTTVLVGTIDKIPVGFLLGRTEDLLPQADGALMGSIRLIFTEPEARDVGVGEALISKYLESAREQGIALFDAHVPPGHRQAKNFFESNGFSARRIVMHHADSATRRQHDSPG